LNASSVATLALWSLFFVITVSPDDSIVHRVRLGMALYGCAIDVKSHHPQIRVSGVSLMISTPVSAINMAEVTDIAALAAMQAQQQRFRRNSDWLQANLATVYARHRGKCICVCGGELFVAGSAEEVMSRARAAHPEDDGLLLRYVPRRRMERVYAH
jgi:hypothetical protein